MLNQLNHWVYIAGLGVDALLLLRIVQLKLYRTYLFITLVAALGLFFDASALWFGAESREAFRILIYSRFLYALAYPAAAFDVWEEMTPQIARIRNFAAVRLVLSITVAALIGLAISAASVSDDSGSDVLVDTFAVILWAAVSTASLAFLWTVHRGARLQKASLPSNTSVWLLYFQMLLALEALSCFLIIIGQQFSSAVNGGLDLSLNIFNLVITLWCVWKLRPLASNMPSAPENASL